ncbi:glyceraldehyde-3-phosphate dehydrogenase (NAD+) [Malonomonas rubra DSM 5091]|uniref:Glyceraldehyde-3-phosphate dehydrogenase n=1 Tax=Malonomonas rubra DSM 5091 TaxID=1122189 RepID=A0A1M6EUZ9_MALRU|nr:ArsJ-associated glyceraldehyde-3-phosphate dehydrogenase [Malonomonas rubra]SHI89160.1 glyceraldehyde-3-phosphate dehydrogenase (NAD+) [Malonomonas rubra DSM 5091]
MSIKVGINGFGRMGRLAVRAAWEWPEFEIVHINEIKGGAECAAHLLEFDSVHGHWDKQIGFSNDALTIDGKNIGFSEHSAPGDVPWDELGVDIVIEASGKFRTTELLQPYYDRGVKKVIVAAPVKQGALNIVMGVNDHLYDPAEHHLLTAASCTTNCLAPVVKVLHEKIGIEHGVITTIHDATNTQVVIDAPHKDLRRARAASMSLIPTTTGSATAITLIYPELKGKLNGHAIRVPLLTGSITDAVFEMKREITAEEVNQLFHEAAQGELKGILGIEDRPLVSIDFKSDTRSGIVDGPSTMVVDGNQLKVFIWYDNEMGYAHRMMELCRKVAVSL